MSRDPIKLTVGLGFAGVLALMGLISFISLSQLNSLTEQMSTLNEDTSAKISAANTMRDSIRLRGETLHRMYLTDDYIERDEYRLQLSKHGLSHKQAREKLFTYKISAREAKLLNKIIKQTRSSKSLNDIAADNLLSSKSLAGIKNDLREADSARQKMMALLGELVVLQEDISHAVIEDTRSYQRGIGSTILLLSLAAFFIAVYIAQLVIRETSKKNSEIHYQATHDELTRLVNRKEFNLRLKEAHSNAIENHEEHALCFLDLDNFKTINDNCGHKAGDVLLVNITTLIKHHIRSHDIFARLGGDEFGLLLAGCSLEKAIEIAEGIVSLVKHYEFNWKDKKFHIGVSIGLAVINRDTKNVDSVLSQADIACYAAKDMGRNQVHIHGLDNESAKNKHRELSWVAEINNAKTDDRFSLYLQAIENIQCKETTTMYEVLLRLNDDEGSLISPNNFMPAAERFSLMTDVDYWVIEQTFKQLSRLYKTIDNCKLQLFINISANSLNNNKFSDFVIEQYNKYKIAHDSICLEISEIKAIKNVNQAADVISALRNHNIKFALDDFGASTSSFSYLKNLPVNYLKIDGKLIKNLTHSTADKAIVAAINQIGKVMNIKTIAEHVEDAFTLNQLEEIGIDYAQGYYLDHPEHIQLRFNEIINQSNFATKTQLRD